MRLDFTEAQPLAQYMKKGTYTVKITNVEETKTKNGNDQLKITFMNKEKEQIMHFANLDFTNKFARDWMADLLAKIGHNVYGRAVDFNPQTLVGKVCVITVKEEWNDYNSKFYLKIKNIEKATVGADGKIEHIHVVDETPTPEPPKQKQNNDFDLSIPPVGNGFDSALNISDDDLPF